MKIKACIFDASGVLIDDVNAIFGVSNRILQEMRINPVTFQDFQSRTKIPFWEYYKSFGLTEEQAKATDVHFKEFYPQFVDRVALYPEVKEVLENLKLKNIKLGIVTHLPSEVISHHLDEFKIRSHFDAIIGFDDTDEHKPSPKPLLTALSKLKVDTTEAIFVGDMVQDILTGKHAGVKTVAVFRENNSYQLKEQVLAYKPDYSITNLLEIISNGTII